MYEISEPQPFEPQHTQPPKHSGFGIASFALALLAGLATLGFCALAAWAGNQPTRTSSPANLVAFTCCGIGLLINLTGFAFGIVSVAQKNVNKVFGILGLVFNSAILLLYAGFMVLVLVVAVVMVGGM